VAVPVTATLWCLSSGEDLGKGADRGAPPAARFAGKYGRALLSEFDVALDCGFDASEVEVEAWADALLLGAVQGGADAAARAAAGAALRMHVQAAQTLPAPAMTPGALDMLRWYRSGVRGSGEEDAGPGALRALARLAAAAARLCHRRAVLPADAVVAIAVWEERCLVAGGAAPLWAAWREEARAGAGLGRCLAGLGRDVAKAAGGAAWDWGQAAHEE
jgi:hypothetical protein